MTPRETTNGAPSLAIRLVEHPKLGVTQIAWDGESDRHLDDLLNRDPGSPLPGDQNFNDLDDLEQALARGEDVWAEPSEEDQASLNGATP